MEFIEEEIIKILILRPSECEYLDYKEVPYMKNKKHDFIKDVIAMLNFSSTSLSRLQQHQEIFHILLVPMA